MPTSPSPSNDRSKTYFPVTHPTEPPDRDRRSSAFRDRLRGIRRDLERDSAEKVAAILELGADRFSVENGHLADIDRDKNMRTVTAVSGPHSVIEQGASVALSKTYCRRVIAEDAVLALEDAGSQGWAGDPAFEEFGLATYLGMKVIVGGELYGTVCFVDRDPRDEPFGREDIRDLELIVWAIEEQLGQKDQADRLSRTTARLEALFEEAPDMINIHDRAGNLIVPNPRLCEKTGHSEGELTAMKVWDLDAALTSAQARQIWAEMDPGDEYRWEGRYRRSDGSTFPVEVDLRCLDMDGADRFVAISRDITDRKEREAKLRRAKEAAEEADRLKSAFLANMSHEIRTPLASIMGFADLLSEEISGPQARKVELIQESGDRLLETLDNVLHLAQLESGTAEIEAEEANLADLVAAAAEGMRSEAAEKGLEFEMELPEEPARARIDPGLLQRIYTNLLSNAVKFTEEGWVRTVLRVNEEEIILRVADTGIGMEESELDRLLQSFEQASTGLGRDYEGAGIGLTITGRLTEMAGGRLAVDTAVGEGTTITVHLPRWMGEQKRRAEKGPGATSSRSLAEARRVLLVDDDPAIHEIVAEMLPASWDLHAAEGFEEGREIAETREVDLALLDINLKARRSGTDLLRELRRREDLEETPAVALTAYAMEGDAETFLEEGFDGYLAKPFTQEDLRTRLREVTDS